MRAANFRVEVVLDEDDDSYHGVEIDFEKELNRVIGDIYRVVAYKVSNEASGESYLGRYPKPAT